MPFRGKTAGNAALAVRPKACQGGKKEIFSQYLRNICFRPLSAAIFFSKQGHVKEKEEEERAGAAC